jgi:predicted extracellular nuclease
LSSQEYLSIAFWNIENLFDLVDDPNKNDDEFSIGGRKNVTSEIYDLKIKHSAEVLLDLNADILGLCEVENLSVLQDLNRSFAKRDYDIIHYDSPDERGIDNVLLYDKSRFRVLKSKPIRNSLNGKDKTRDILYVLGQFQSDTLHIFVNHWPSNYGGVEQSIPKRAATANLIKNEIKKIQSKNAYAEIVLLGDFNEDPDDANVKSLEEVGLKSLMKSMIGKPKVGTYVYRGKDYFYDQIIINDGLNDNKNLAVVKNSVYILDLPKYRQQEGKYKHYPFRFWAGSRLLGGYSDHLAVKFLIKNVNFSK